MVNLLDAVTQIFGKPAIEQEVEPSQKIENKIVPGEEILNIDENKVIHIFKQVYQHAYNVKKNHIIVWDKVWALFNNQYDFSQKADWQAKAYTTKFNGAIRTLMAILKRSVLGAKKIFSVEGIGYESKLKQANVENLLYYWFYKSNFRHEFTKSLMAGVLSSLTILKAYWNNGIKMEACDPYDITLDPTGRNKFIIHRIKMDLYDVQKLANEGVYNAEKVALIKEGFVRAELEYKEKLRRNEPGATPPPFRKEVEIMEYYGDLFDEDGSLIQENVIITIANDNHLLRIVKNPYPIKPFFIYPLYFVPFSVYHKGFFEDVVTAGLIDEMSRVLNGIIDGHLFSIAKAFELNVDIVVDPEEIQSGIYPGKTIKRTGFSNERLIQEVNVGNISQQNLAVYEMLAREFQNATSITEFIMGMPTSRGRPTATEVMQKTQQTMSALEDNVRDLEQYLIVPLLGFVFDLIIKYQDDFTNAQLQEFLGPKLDYTLTLEQFKEKYLSGQYEFRVNGISQTLLKQQTVEKIALLFQLLQANPIWASKLDLDRLLYKILESLDLDPTELIIEQQGGQEQQVGVASPISTQPTEEVEQ